MEEPTKTAAVNDPASQVKTVITEIADAELTLLKGPLLGFAQSMQQPNANLESLREDVANIMLQVPQLSGSAQSVMLNIVGAALEQWISTLGTAPNPAPAPAPSPEPASSGNGGSNAA